MDAAFPVHLDTVSKDSEVEVSQDAVAGQTQNKNSMNEMPNTTIKLHHGDKQSTVRTQPRVEPKKIQIDKSETMERLNSLKTWSETEDLSANGGQIYRGQDSRERESSNDANDVESTYTVVQKRKGKKIRDANKNSLISS
jgi:hypothetical protein